MYLEDLGIGWTVTLMLEILLKTTSECAVVNPNEQVGVNVTSGGILMIRELHSVEDFINEILDRQGVTVTEHGQNFSHRSLLNHLHHHVENAKLISF